jgi:hypothetical protein
MLLHDKGENAHDHNRACYHDRKLPPIQQSILNHKCEDHGDMRFFKSAQYQDHRHEIFEKVPNTKTRLICPKVNTRRAVIVERMLLYRNLDGKQEEWNSKNFSS